MAAAGTNPDVDSGDRKDGLRTGWTTGTCASAAAKAAVIGLETGVVPASVEVGLPNGRRVRFDTEDINPEQPNRVAIIKDAGDDPDCTDGAHVTATVTWQPGVDSRENGGENGELVQLAGGDGVGQVTKPGLGLEVNSPAINPVPARMIRAAIAEVTDRAVRCEISVPGGQKMAQKTSNDRLGIVGGISILGTTGVVRPFSTASYRASVVQQIDVAAAQAQTTIYLSTGSRSDRWAQHQWPQKDTVCFVEVGDFTGIALRRAWSKSITRIVFVGMAGKIAKLADGVMMTHFHRSQVNTKLLEQVAVDSGGSASVVKAATETTTARHFAESCLVAGETEPLRRLCQLAAANCQAHIASAPKTTDPRIVSPENEVSTEAGATPNVEAEVTVVMVDFEGQQEICRG